MNDFAGQIRGIAEKWPDEGYVAGVLPDRSDPEWSGRAILELIGASDRSGGPSVVVDLAPETTDLSSRFEAGRGPGLAELAAGEAELWEISHRSDLHRAVYLSEGEGAPGADLAGSEAAELAGKLSGSGRLLLVVLDREGAEAAASAGYLDGVVRIGEADGAPEQAGVEELGRITARPGDRRELPDRDGGPRLVLPPEMRSERRRRRRIRRALIGLAILVALGLVAFGILGEQELGDLLSRSQGRSAPVERVDARQAERSPAAAAADSAAPAADFAAGSRESPDSVAAGSSAAGASDVGPGDTASPRAGQAGASAAGEGEDSGDPGPAEGTGPVPAQPAPESGGPPGFRAVADSLALGVRDFVREAGRFRAGEIGCGALIEARRRADQLFERLWLERMSLQPPPDSPAAATFRERARQMETVERAYEATSCPARAFEGP